MSANAVTLPATPAPAPVVHASGNDLTATLTDIFPLGPHMEVGVCMHPLSGMVATPTGPPSAGFSLMQCANCGQRFPKSSTNTYTPRVILRYTG